MPRQPRIQFEGACYHVFSRGNRRERIFVEDRDYARYEDIMLEATAWSGVSLYNWNLMPNHFHMLLDTPEGNLSEFMSRLLTRFAKYFNWAHHFVGHVFQGRYGSILCDKDNYFLELVRYIALNADRVKGKPLAEPGAWKWSSHRYLMMPESQWPAAVKRSFGEVLGRFGQTPQMARRNYARFLADGLRDGHWEDFYKVKGNRFLGDDAFVEKVKRKAGEAVREAPRPMKSIRSVEELAQAAQSLSGLSADQLSGSSRKKDFNAWRQALVYVGRRYGRLSIKALAQFLGRDPSAASQILRRREGRWQESPEVRRLLEALRI